MHLRILLLASALIAFAVSVEASPQKQFNAAYRAYNAAIEQAQYDEAVRHARAALRFARRVLDGKSQEVAILNFNHGYALARAGRKRDAYRALIDAQVLATKAFGADAEELIQVEIELAYTGLPQLAINHLKRALELAEKHHGEDSEFVADIKVEGGTRIWKDGAVELLAQAAEAYQRLGNSDKYVLAQYWLGKRHLDDGRQADAIAPMTEVVNAQPGDGKLALMARRILVEALEHAGQRDRATEHCLAIGSATAWTGVEGYEPLYKRTPAYPEDKRARQIEGSVLIEFTVDVEGYVKDPFVISSGGGLEFEAPALAAIAGFRYAPRFVDGSPVPVEGVRYRVVFALRD
ncbi:MAG: TonB family protein [Gammaproteobacteria bacterium]|nr:TonB family protein [Gammaproteobacteria bacterium]